MCDKLLETEAELAALAEMLPAAADGYVRAALYGLPTRPTIVELFDEQSNEPTVYVRRRGKYQLQDPELDLLDILQEAV